jgi:hypothetical protein
MTHSIEIFHRRIIPSPEPSVAISAQAVAAQVVFVRVGVALSGNAMLASSEDAVLRAEPGVYEGFGEGSKLVADGTWVHKETVKASIRIELDADGTFVHTATVDGKPWLMKGSYVLTTAGVDFTPEGKKPFSIRVVKGIFQCGIGLGDTLSLKRVQ